MASTEEFIGKAMNDMAGMMTSLMATMGDKLGLFRALTKGPATSAELAERAQVNERYAREWLGGMTCAGYLTHDPATGRFTLPPEHAPVLAQENGPMFFGGIYQNSIGALEQLPRILDVFKHGGGVPSADYNDDFWCGLTRLSASWFENLLVPVWLPSIPDAKAKLEAGGTLADVGTGHGRALIKLAQAFPKARFTGYDFLQKSVDRARANAQEAGVADRVTFEQADVSKGLPQKFDVITTFDVVHDAVDPKALLKSIRQTLNPGGIYICLDINCSDQLAQMAGPMGAVFHGVSLFYCMTSSLAAGGAGLGTCGLHEKKLNELASEAGFSSVRRVPLENPFNNLYELR
jgi:SAM-dependent methyltransferase